MFSFSHDAYMAVEQIIYFTTYREFVVFPFPEKEYRIWNSGSNDKFA